VGIKQVRCTKGGKKVKKTSIFKRLLSLVMCMVLVLGFVPVLARAEDDTHEHIPYGEVYTVAPTCISDGYDCFQCAICWDYIYINETPALAPDVGHTKVDGEVFYPTCDEGGYTSYICPVCNAAFDGDQVPALGHSFDENGICAVCGGDEANLVVISMRDIYSDSWNGAGISVFADGDWQFDVTLYDYCDSTYSFMMDPQMQYEFRWQKGNYDEECAFVMTIGGEEVCSADFDECQNFVQDQLLYPICEHDYQFSDACDATCTTEGYDIYICTLCGESKHENVVPALGHSIDEDGVCAVCGIDVNHLMTINMIDYANDGWNGSSIAFYEDGQIVAFVTLEEGGSGSWSYEMDPEKAYKLTWGAGGYDHECAFEILVGDTVVLTADSDYCAGLEDGAVLYPVCAHEMELVQVVDPTCTMEGYSIYSCALCGELSFTDYVPYTGHSLTGAYEVVAPTCQNEGYTVYFCENCEEGDRRDYVPMMGHTPTGNGQVVSPTCVAAGVTYDTCVHCGTDLCFDFISAPGHTLGEDGNCTVCGEPYDSLLWVAGVYVTGENHQDILGDGTASFDPATKTLTLNNFVYEGDETGIYTNISLNIALEGDNSITTTADNGIEYEDADGSLSFTGSGFLMISSAQCGISQNAISGAQLTFGEYVTILINDTPKGICVDADMAQILVQEDASLHLGTRDLPLTAEGIYCWGNTSSTMTITDGAWVRILGTDGYGLVVDSDASSLTISGDAQVDVDCSGIGSGVSAENVTVSGGTVYIAVVNSAIGLDATDLDVSGGEVSIMSGPACIGLYAENTTISGGVVDVGGSDLAIIAGTLTVTGGELRAYGENCGINTNRGFTITGGRVEVMRGGLRADMVALDGTPLDGDAVTLGEGVSVALPEGGALGQFFNGYDTSVGVLDEYGNYADSFVISDGAVVAYGAGFSVSFEDEVLLNFYYYTDASADLEQGVLVFDEMPENPDIADADWIYPTIYADGAGFYAAQTDGIPAKEMGDERWYVAYIKQADGRYVYSDATTYCPADYAYNKLADESADPELKALCVALLNYGAAAQQFFGYRTDALMNAYLTEEEKALVTSFSFDLLNGAVASGKDTTFVKTEGFRAKSASVSFEGALAINYYFTPTADVDDITFYYWTAEDYANADVLTAENATGSMLMQQSGSSYWAQVDDIAAKEIDDTIYVAATYEKDGVTCCTGVIAYSISTYCRNQANGTMALLPTATAAYCYYARQYFGN
jgi:hypothetical protein